MLETKMLKCSGCGVCSAICPKHCITMKLNNDGFYNPVKDKESCVNCSLCEDVCYIRKKDTISLDKMRLYSAEALDLNVLRESSSGGIAWLIAQNAIINGYAVCGVVYNYKAHRAEHQIFYSAAGLEQLKGSKYLQSYTQKAFEEILNVLQKCPDKKFLVFGTPCQIASLSNALRIKKLRDRVILVDIFCHGVPSNLLWQKYMSWLNDKHGIEDDKIMNLKFRDKEYSWHKYFMHVSASKSGGMVIEYIAEVNNDPFLKLFTMGVVNQESCFSCPFRNQTAADIRLGDYWGSRFLENEKGVSMVLVNTEIGSELINSIKTQANVSIQDIKERFGQQHTDYQYPKYYNASLSMLKDDCVQLRSVINLYETDFDRLKQKVKKFIKKIFRLY